jgi:hypothetical protein
MKVMNSARLALFGGLMLMSLARPVHAEPDSGACCLPDGTCEVVSELVCNLVGGAYQGNGTDCETVDCQGWGACCFVDYGCENLTAAECESLGGVYNGDGSTCGPGVCPSLAACCFDDGFCQLLTNEACTDAGGTFIGAHTDCTTTDCLGACCFYSGTCLDGLTPERCETLHGLFRGFGSECQTTDCSTLVQERAYSFDQRERPTQYVFEFDKFQENGRRKLRRVVAEFTGSICAGLVLQNLGDSPIHTGVAINEYLRWDFPTLDEPHAAIDIVDLMVYCGDEEYLLPPAESCDYGGLLTWPDDAPAELTVIIEDPDELLGFLGGGAIEASVKAAGSVSYGGVDFKLTNSPHHVEGSVRLTYQYEWLGACCYYDGSCQLLTEPECDADSDPLDGDSWSVSWSKGLRCDEVYCPVFGACCLSAGCFEMTAAGCEAEDGLYQGEGSDCETASCPGVPWGACCFEDAVCQDGLTQAPCNEAGGIFMGFGSDCDHADCPWVLPNHGLPWSADFNGNGAVAVEDMIILLGAWGNAGGPEDLNEDGIVDAADMALLLSHWGPCPPPPDPRGTTPR